MRDVLLIGMGLTAPTALQSLAASCCVVVIEGEFVSAAVHHNVHPV
jgi:hypothetical protein